MRKRFIVELGLGTDLHGQDVTKAGRRAVREAVCRKVCKFVGAHGRAPRRREITQNPANCQWWPAA